ncbi:hypothetical protein GJAV_G00104790 [Gymnothorax javanicus]|nr:hypothetical protein GJAV_G00104790 [Gymnothorax javanicus]
MSRMRTPLRVPTRRPPTKSELELSVKMSAAGTGAGGSGPGPGSGVGSGACNPRKFSEKIALHTQRQAEETAAFQEVMMDITSTRIQAQKMRLGQMQCQYGGSLPNVNQIGRTTPDQAQFHSSLESTRSTRHHGLVERVHRERRFTSPVRPYRRQTDSSPYASAYLSPPPDHNWRRNWCGSFPADKHQLVHLPISGLNRTNSDSALHTSVMNPPTRDSLNPHNRHSGLMEGEGRKMFPYPVPPIEENVLDEGGKVLKPWETKKLPSLSSRPKSCEVPGINIFPSPDLPSSAPHLLPAPLNAGGSLPDLSSLHFPSPLPTPLDGDQPPYPSSLSGGSSTGNLASTLTQLGITSGNTFHLPGLSASLQGSYSNPLLQSSLSNPNIQSSLGSHSFPHSLSSASLHSSLSNPSLRSPLSSCPSLRSSLSNQSLQSSHSNSSLSGQSLQSAASNPSFGSGSSPSSYPSLGAGQTQPPITTSPRRRTQLSPLVLPIGGEVRRHHPKQFSPTISPTLSSITQGVPLDTSKPTLDQRLPACPYSQTQTGPPLSHQPMQQSGQQQQQQTQQHQHHQQQQEVQQHQPQQQQMHQHHQQQQQMHQHHLQQTQQHQHHLQQQQIQQHQHHQQQQLSHQHHQQQQIQQHQHHEQQTQQHQHQLQQQQVQQHQHHQQQVQQHQHHQQQTQQHQHHQQEQQSHQHHQQQQIQQLQHHLQQTQQHQQHHPQQQINQLHPQQKQQQHHQHQIHHHPQQQHYQQQIQQQQQRPQPNQEPQLHLNQLQLQTEDHQQGPTDQLYSDSSILSPLFWDASLGVSVPTGQNHAPSQQFTMATGTGGQPFSCGQGSGSLSGLGSEGPYPADPQFLNKQNQNLSLNQNYGGGVGYPGPPDIILTADPSCGLSKEITSVLSGVPGFQGDPSGPDELLRALTEGEADAH